jgi:hypothetical protein
MIAAPAHRGIRCATTVDAAAKRHVFEVVAAPVLVPA